MVRVGAVAGVEIGGELRLEDESGNIVAENDHDPAGFLGIAFSARFWIGSAGDGRPASELSSPFGITLVNFTAALFDMVSGIAVIVRAGRHKFSNKGG